MASPDSINDLNTSASGQKYFTRGYVEAVMTSGQVWANGCKTMTRTMRDTADANFATAMTGWKAIGAAKTPKEAMALQADLARAAIARTAEAANRLTAESMTIIEQAMAPFTSPKTAVMVPNIAIAPHKKTVEKPQLPKI